MTTATHNKDSFLTVSYKGGYIHTCCNRETGKTEVKVQLPDNTTRTAASVHGAKYILTRYNAQDQ